MDIIICPLEKSPFTHSDVVELIKNAFVQWLDSGLSSSLSKLDEPLFIIKTKDATILVAFDDKLLGTTTFSISKDRTNRLYAYNKFSAINPKTKGNGLGSLLLQEEIKRVKELGCKYIISDTSVHASWSINWHKKNGFQIIGLDSFSTNDYFSYIFRLSLEKNSIWNRSWFCKLVYFLSYCKTHTLKKKNGQSSKLAQIVIETYKFIHK